jgi:uncharacterized protein (TIGR03067 family)
MKTRNLITFCGLTILLAVGIVGCTNQSSEKTPEKASLQGRWSGFEAGDTAKITIAFSGNQFTYWDATTNELGGGTFVVNDTVQPNQIDLTFERMLAPNYVGKVALAIYELQQDELKFAGAEPGSPVRPTNIAGGQGVRTFTLKRE